jgi:hypothetical protein
MATKTLAASVPAWLINIGGILLAILGWATSGPVISVMPPKIGAIVSTIGALLAALGIHGAIARNDASNATGPGLPTPVVPPVPTRTTNAAPLSTAYKGPSSSSL